MENRLQFCEFFCKYGQAVSIYIGGRNFYGPEMLKKPNLQDAGHVKKHNKDDAPLRKSELRKSLLAKSIWLLLADYKPEDARACKPDS